MLLRLFRQFVFFFSSRRRHTRLTCDWSSDVCSSDLLLLALPVLGERMTASRIGAVVLGLMGVLVILRPGLQTFQPAALLVLLAALGFAIALITTKKLTRTDTNFAIIFWMNLIQL